MTTTLDSYSIAPTAGTAGAAPSTRDLSAVIKAYDIRGVVPDQLDSDTVRTIGAAAAELLVLDAGATAIVVGHDMRPSSPDLVEAFSEGATSRGVDVIDIGLASTDQLYFASGFLGLPGAMFTASHNPAQYNGIKLCRAGAAPVGQDTGLRAIRALTESGLPPTTNPAGTRRHHDLLHRYAAYLHALVPLDGIRPLTLVVDAGNGMAGHTAPAVLNHPALNVIEMYYELDGTFPNHEANPIEPANLRDLQARVIETGADIGLAFDGDADRCFVIDQSGKAVSPSTLTGLIAARELSREPGATILHNLITSRAVAEIVTEHGGTPVRTRVGHSFIKQTMAETGAIFGGEHSGHFYFRDFWRADSGMLAALHTLAALGQAPEGSTLADLLAPYSRYHCTGEINTTVADAAEATQRVRSHFAGYADTTTDTLDGLTITHPNWWLNVRPSNTEPLLRLNAEATNPATLSLIANQVLTLINQPEEPTVAA